MDDKNKENREVNILIFHYLTLVFLLLFLCQPQSKAYVLLSNFTI